MNWLICGILSLIMCACMIFFSTKFKNFWRGWYVGLAVVNGISAILDFVLHYDCRKTVIIDAVCAGIMVAMVAIYIVLELRVKRLEKKIAAEQSRDELEA